MLIQEMTDCQGKIIYGVSWFHFLFFPLSTIFINNVGVWISDTGKSSWPELVGTTGQAAAATIERENPRVDAIVILNGAPVTGDFRCDRVWVRVNSRGIVVQAPGIG